MTLRTFVSSMLLSLPIAVAATGLASAQAPASAASSSSSSLAPSAAPVMTSAVTASAEGAQRPSRAAAGPPEPAVRLSVFYDVGSLALSASHTFKAIFDGKDSGLAQGFGAEVTLRSGIFVRGDVGWFSKDGERVFVSNGQIFPLGQPLTVKMTPIEFTGGYRFFAGRRAGARNRFRVQPYAGAGAGVLRYREESSTDEPGESTEESFTSYHVLGGVDVTITDHLSAGGELQHRWVPDAIGKAGVSQIYSEKDLGGDTFRALVRWTF